MKPIKATYSGMDTVGLAEFIAADTIGVEDGGTGATTPADARSALSVAANGVNTDITSLSGSVELSFPNYTNVINDAHKVIFYDLDNTNHVWDWDEAKKLIRNTSWYVELGMPPVHGMFVIDASQNAIHWIDRENVTMVPYMTFTGAAGTMLEAGTIKDIAVLDFKLCYCDGTYRGFSYIDFLADEQHTYVTAGHYKHNTNILGRNTGSANDTLYNASVAIVNSTVNGVALCRAPSGGDDHFGRPLHYWAASTEAGSGNPHTIYNPISDDVYDIGTGTGLQNIDCIISLGGSFVTTSVTVSGALSDYVVVQLYIESITADGVSMTQNIHTSGSVPMTGAATVRCIAILDNASVTAGYPVILAGYDEGLLLIHMNGTSYQDIIWLTSAYATPLLDKSTTVAAYPLDSVTDRSGNGYTLTNVGTTPFTGTSPLGVACPDFDGSSQQLTLADNSVLSDGTYTEFTISCYAKCDILPTTAGHAMHIVDKANADSGTDMAYYVAFTALDQIGFLFRVNGVIKQVNSPQNLVKAGVWYHVVAVYDGAACHLYVDGVLIGSIAATGGITDCTNPLVIGDATGGGNRYFDGQIANVSLQNAAWTADEIRLEHSRMVAGLAGNTTLLTADDIDSVRVDPDTGYAIVTAGDTAHIMDAKTGIILETDTIGTGTLNDADIISMDGADTPHYVLGGSTTIEQVAPNVRVK